jgi:hypothetical protein
MTYFQPPAIVVPTPFQPPVLTQSHIKGGVGSPWGATAPLGSLRHCVSKLLEGIRAAPSMVPMPLFHNPPGGAGVGLHSTHTARWQE